MYRKLTGAACAALNDTSTRRRGPTPKVRRGVSVSGVVLGHGGDRADIPALPGFKELSLAAGEHKVTLLTTMMGVGRLRLLASVALTSLGYRVGAHGRSVFVACVLIFSLII